MVWNGVKKLSNKAYFIKSIWKHRGSIEKGGVSLDKIERQTGQKIELEEFRVSDHIYKDSINESGIPVIKGKPSFLLHSLPSDNEEGYIPKNMLSALLKKVMTQRWLFLMGTSG